MGVIQQHSWTQLDGAGGYDFYVGLISTKTLAARVAEIGSVVSELHIKGAETVSASLDIPENVTVIMHAGSVLTLSGSGTELGINGKCVCLGGGVGKEHFNIDAQASLWFGKSLIADAVSLFTGDGKSRVYFGYGAQLLPPEIQYLDTNFNWTLTTHALIADGTLHDDGTAFTGNQVYDGLAATIDKFYRITCLVSSVVAGSITMQMGAGAGQTISATPTGPTTALVLATQVTAPRFVAAAFRGTIDWMSVREAIPNNITEIYPEWWGAVGDMTTQCSDAIQYALNRAAVSYLAPVPRTVRLGIGKFLVEKKLLLFYYAHLKGTENNTWLMGYEATPGAFPDDRMIEPYSYADIGSRTYMDMMTDIHVSSENIAKDAFTIMRNTYMQPMGAVYVRRCRFRGNVSYQQAAITVDARLNNCNELRIRETTFKDFKSYKITNGVVNNDYPAVGYLHDGGCQMYDVSDCNFNCAGTHLRTAGSNYTIQRNNFESEPDPGVCITLRYSKYAYTVEGDTLTATIANPCVVTWANPAATHPWTSTTLYRQALIRFTDGGGSTGWAAKSGLYIAVFGGSANAWTVTYTDCDTSGCTGTPASILIEFVGGFLCRTETYGRGAIYRENYYDGDSMRIDIMATWNTAVNSAECSVISDENRGIQDYSIGNFIASGTAQVPLTYTGAAVVGTPTQVTVAANVSATILASNYVWIYQYQSGSPYHVFGYIRAAVSSSVYSAPNTVITLTESMIREDTVIKIVPETTGHRLKTNFWCRYRGEIQAQVPTS